MNEKTLQATVEEFSPQLIGRKFGRIFMISRLNLVIDFRLNGGLYLFISVEPSAPRIYLINRKLRDLEKQSVNPTPFVLLLKKKLSGAIIRAISKHENDRIVRLDLQTYDEIDGHRNYSLVAQLTGRSANIFLLDDADFVIDSMRENRGAGQTTATKFAPPIRDVANRSDTELFPKNHFATLSEALDQFYQKQAAEKLIEAQIKSLRSNIRQEIARREKLQRKLREDLENHGEADKWKRLGDLLLANLADAVRIDKTVLVVDYFDDSAPTIEIEVEPNVTLTEAAEKFFKRYTKARNAKVELEKRLENLSVELEQLERRKSELEIAIGEKNLSAFLPKTEPAKQHKIKEKQADSFKGARRFMSSDGLEILVGKASKDNDFLTFRVAKSLDFWLHAADYGGSHVIIRNPNRLPDIPPKTLLEAAQLAAFFSQAKAQPKVAVNYTQKKFVNKPKGAAAGMVVLSGFKTILVEPSYSLERM